ncbi:glycoside hydrolase/deacetylase [Thelephora ganbajun]|uniref:Glycoside hydrolase/deacetylase n=1 Tax=Thelephora ganbajun TaxID=370292 RepID=A0ACB6ZP13_THEGA|nr:glycoside hydrolase/deacetylase [Thelephora ganbajun]
MVLPVLPVLPALLLLPLLALAHPTPHPDGSDCSEERSLPSRWYHESGHPVEQLFNRQNGVNPTDGVAYPAVGSPQWSAGFPDYIPDLNHLPQEWVNALNTAVAAGKIPDNPVATDTGGTPTYPPGVNPGSPEICSASVGCRSPYDIWDAPNGVLGISFDDGPSSGSAMLYDFLKQSKAPSTHFMIGYNIKLSPALFLRAFEELGSDIAVHTWSHRHMTTLSNLAILGEFGWSMELIKNSTGGRLPRYWRPPYGDADNRVRAIAREVFGLQTIIWNRDTSDWSLPGGTTLQAINASMTQWLNGPKSPGLVILEHELTNLAAQAFIDAYPLMVSTGWKIESVADIDGKSVYLNSQDSISPVQRVNGVLLGQTVSLVSSTSSTPSSTSTSDPAKPTTTSHTGSNNTGTNTSQSGKNGSIQSTISKFAGAFGAVFLTVVFYACITLLYRRTASTLFLASALQEHEREKSDEIRLGEEACYVCIHFALELRGEFRTLRASYNTRIYVVEVLNRAKRNQENFTFRVFDRITFGVTQLVGWAFHIIYCEVQGENIEKGKKGEKTLEGYWGGGE